MFVLIKTSWRWRQKKSSRRLHQDACLLSSDKDSSNNFISFTLNYSKSKSMKSKIQFEIHLSTNEVQFLDLSVSLKHEKLRTTLFIQWTDSQFYANISSCHPPHVLKYTPKGQVIQLRHICSENRTICLTEKSCVKKLLSKWQKWVETNCYEREP